MLGSSSVAAAAAAKAKAVAAAAAAESVKGGANAQKPLEWLTSLLTRFEEQVCTYSCLYV